MDDKTRSLLKKHIRMIDYIRADLVRILGGETPRKPTDPMVLDPGADIKRPLPISPLYQNFEAAKVAPVTDAEGRHSDTCRCFGCIAKARIAEGVEVCSGCRFTPDRCICGHFPLHGAAGGDAA